MSKKKKVDRTKALLYSYRHQDKKKGYTTDLTAEQLGEVIRCPCSYCGGKEKIGADRLDNSRGHDWDNIVPACRRCNKIKSDVFTYDEMQELAKFFRTVVNRRGKGFYIRTAYFK